MVFRLLTFVLIACYVRILVADGYTLLDAVLAAIAVALGAWASSGPAPSGRLALRRV